MTFIILMDKYVPVDEIVVWLLPGISESRAVCMQKDDRSVVRIELCFHLQKPDKRSKYCNEEPCPAEWVMFGHVWHRDCKLQCYWNCKCNLIWTVLSATGTVCEAPYTVDLSKTIYYSKWIYTLTEGENWSISCCRWHIGEWTECSETCGGGYKTRSVVCVHQVEASLQEVMSFDSCPGTRPITRMSCNKDTCPPHWATDGWSDVRFQSFPI